MDILVLVLGGYMDIKKYVDDLPFEHEDKLIVKKGDLYNLKYRDGKGVFKIKSEGSDLNMQGINEESIVTNENKQMVMNVLFDNNGCRRKSKDDMIGIYGSDTTLSLYLEEGIDEISVDIYYNYLIKSQVIEGKPYLLYIIDNSPHSINTYNNIEYILNMYECDSHIYTEKSLNSLEDLKTQYEKKGVEIVLGSII